MNDYHSFGLRNPTVRCKEKKGRFACLLVNENMALGRVVIVSVSWNSVVVIIVVSSVWMTTFTFVS